MGQHYFKTLISQAMRKYIKLLLALLLVTFAWAGCTKHFPVDEDGLLITTRTDCYVSNFDLLGADFNTVLTGSPVIDTSAGTVKAVVFFGTDLKNLYPQFSLATDCKLDPKITGKVDFSDTTHRKIYTVISGNRKIRKPYTVYITVQ